MNDEYFDMPQEGSGSNFYPFAGIVTAMIIGGCAYDYVYPTPKPQSQTIEGIVQGESRHVDRLVKETIYHFSVQTTKGIYTFNAYHPTDAPILDSLINPGDEITLQKNKFTSGYDGVYSIFPHDIKSINGLPLIK
jgi:hypothetical protein